MPDQYPQSRRGHGLPGIRGLDFLSHYGNVLHFHVYALSGTGMQETMIAFDRFKPLQDETCQERILAARSKLGKRAVILSHHYQRADVYKHADLTGDSL